ncbi:MAG: hypothetical protein ACR2PL_17770, partial [Dehalococcoidia bacterium]
MQKLATSIAAPRVRSHEQGTAVRRSWLTALDLDLSRPLPATVLGFVYVVVHLPWLSLGYGADPD